MVPNPPAATNNDIKLPSDQTHLKYINGHLFTALFLPWFGEVFFVPFTLNRTFAVNAEVIWKEVI